MELETLAVLMIVGLLVFLMLGYPVAFTLGAVGLIFGVIGFGFDFFNLLPLRIYGVMTNYTLLAIPLFVFMGVMLERSGLAEDLLETMGLLFGRMRGGLAISVVVVGALLGASTGIVGATVVTMGLLSLPTMLRRNYLPEMATGTICASGTLGQIIPPSLVLIVLADILGISVGAIFVAAFIPGLMLAGIFVVAIALVAFFFPNTAPAIPAEERARVSSRALFVRAVKVLLPIGALIFAVLGSILMGLAAPTRAAGMGCVGAILITVLNGRFTLERLREVNRSTTRITCIVMMILVGAQVFGLSFRGLDGDILVHDMLAAMPGEKWGVIAFIMGLLFFLGFFLEWIEITFIVVPIIAPALEKLGIDLLWFAIVICMNLQTSFLTPPFGWSLFFLKGVAPPEVTTGHIYRGIIPFVVLQLVGLGLLLSFPEMALWLPRLIGWYE
ncbi:MAG: TRAP transporter large permease subunit [candidate division NC10 bacterium]|nr:TRAP transporter large permease subunit [candidate division NC10 bacterium]MCZ6550660.1 TRAP transporter large permease subunit [candidate division NC10 bacterium]